MTEFPRRATAPGIHPDAPAVQASDVPVIGLMIATPMGGGGLCDMAYHLGSADLRAECATRGIRLDSVFLRGESDIQQGRNRCMAHFLASSCSHLLFIDADVGFTPDAVFRLLAHNRPIVGATYAKKVLGPVQFAVAPLDNGARTDALVEVAGLPGGFLMIQRGAAERMAGAYGHLAYSLRDGGTPDGESWRGHMINLFGSEMSADGTRYSEDLSFCRRWRQIGGQVWLDPHILLEHWGIARFAGHPAEMFPPPAAPARVRARR